MEPNEPPENPPPGTPADGLTVLSCGYIVVSGLVALGGLVAALVAAVRDRNGIMVCVVVGATALGLAVAYAQDRGSSRRTTVTGRGKTNRNSEEPQ